MRKILTLFTLFAFLAIPSMSLAAGGNPFDNALKGVVDTQKEATSFSSENLPVSIGKVINSIIGILGIIALILAIYNGFKIIFSKGDPEILKKSKDAFFYAVFGLVIILVAYGISSFIINLLDI